MSASPSPSPVQPGSSPVAASRKAVTFDEGHSDDSDAPKNQSAFTKVLSSVWVKVQAVQESTGMAGVISEPLIVKARTRSGRLGRALAKRPLLTLVLTALATLALLPGLGELAFADFVDALSYTDSRYYEDYQLGDALFPHGRRSEIIFTSTRGSIMSKTFLQAGLEMERQVKEKVRSQNGASFGDVCVRTQIGGPCDWSSVFSLLVPNETLLETMADDTPPAELASMLLADLVFTRRPLLALVVGDGSPNGPRIDPGTAVVADVASWLGAAGSARATFSLESGPRSAAFEDAVAAFAEKLGSLGVGAVRLSVLSRRSGDAAALNDYISKIWVIVFAWVVMTSYSLLFLASSLRQKGQTQVLVILTFSGVLAVSSLAGLGLLGYCGLQVRPITILAPLLSLILGFDGLFSVASALEILPAKAADDAAAVLSDSQDAISAAFAAAGPGLMVRSTAATTAFFVSLIVSRNVPGFVSFNVALIFQVLVAQSCVVVLLPALLALNERRIAAGRADLTPWWRSRPGLDSFHSWDPAPKARKMLNDGYASYVEDSLWFLIFGMLVTVVLVVVAILGILSISSMDSGMIRGRLPAEGPSGFPVVDELQKWYGSAEIAEVGLLVHEPALASAAYRADLSAFAGDLLEAPGAEWLDCWLADFSAGLLGTATEAEVEASLTLHLSTAAGLRAQRDALLASAGELRAARCRLFVRQPLEPKARAEQGKAIVDLVDRASGIIATAFHESFAVDVAGSEEMRSLTLQSVCFGVLVLAILLIALIPMNWAIIASFCACCVGFMLFVFLDWFDITLNEVTYPSGILAMGFCWTVLCRISRAAANERKGALKIVEPVRLALQKIGYEMMHSCAVSFLGAVAICLGDFESFRLFGLILAIAILFTALTALVALPAVARFLDDFPLLVERCARGKWDEVIDRQRQLNQHLHEHRKTSLKHRLASVFSRRGGSAVEEVEDFEASPANEEEFEERTAIFARAPESEARVKEAVKFLSHPAVRIGGWDQKRQFLEAKGLDEDEVFSARCRCEELVRKEEQQYDEAEFIARTRWESWREQAAAGGELLADPYSLEEEEESHQAQEQSTPDYDPTARGSDEDLPDDVPPMRSKSSLPEGWYTAVEKGGEVYYFNEQGGSSWERPTEVAPRIPADSEEASYLLESSELAQMCSGLRHRTRRWLTEFHPTLHSAWGDIFRGVDLGDGWLLTRDGTFLPLVAREVSVLRRVEERNFIATDLHFESSPGDGIPHCLSRSRDDKHESAMVPWGGVVRGIDLGDGWVKTFQGTFLPTRLGKVEALMPVEAFHAVRHAQLPSVGTWSAMRPFDPFPEVGKLEPPMPATSSPSPKPKPLLTEVPETGGAMSVLTPKKMKTAGLLAASRATEKARSLGGVNMMAAPIRQTLAVEMAKLGRASVAKPIRFVVGALLSYAVFFPGLAMLEGDHTFGFVRIHTDFFDEFAPKDSVYRSDYELGTSFFGQTRENRLMFTPAVGQTIMSQAFLEVGRALELQTLAGLSAVCSRPVDGAECDWLSPFKLLVPTDTALAEAVADAGDAPDASALAQALLQGMSLDDKKLLPVVIGNPVYSFPGADAEDLLLGQWLATSTAVQTTFGLLPGSASVEFESRMRDLIEERRSGSAASHDVVQLSGDLASSLGSATASLANGPGAAVGAAVVGVLYAVAFMGAEPRVRSKGAGTTVALVVLAGAVVPLLSSSASLGLMGYMGIRISIIAVASGLINFVWALQVLFIIIGEWKAVGHREKKVGEVASTAMGRGAANVVATGFVLALAFASAGLASSNSPGLAAAGLFTAVQVVFTTAGLCAVLPAMLCAAESEAALTRLARIAGKLKKVAPCGCVNPTKASRRWFIANVAPLPSHSVLFRVVGLLLSFCLLVAGIARTAQLSSADGVLYKFLFMINSYMSDYYTALEQSFLDKRLREVSILFEAPTLHDSSYRQGVVSWLAELSARPDVVSVDCWMDTLSASLSGSLTAAEATVAVFAYLSGSAGETYIRDANFENGILKAARCRANVWQPVAAETEAQQCEELRALAASGDVPVTVYHRAWPAHVARREAGRGLLLGSVVSALVVTAVGLFFVLPADLAVATALAGITSTLATIGFVQVAGFACDLFTYSTCVAAVAFSMEYACLVSRGATSGSEAEKGSTWPERMNRGLRHSGVEVFHGCAVTCLAFLVACVGGGSRAAQIWGAAGAVSVLLAALLALVGLPASVSLLFAPGALPALWRKCRLDTRAAFEEARAEEKFEEEEKRNVEDQDGEVGQDTFENRLEYRLPDTVSLYTGRARRIVGTAAARQPGCFVFVGLLAFMLLLQGLWLLEGDVQLFVFRTSSELGVEVADQRSEWWAQREKGISHFPEARTGVVMYLPRDDGVSAFDRSFLRSAAKAEREIKALVAELPGSSADTATLESQCIRKTAAQGGSCEVMSLFSSLLPDVSALDRAPLKDISAPVELATALVRGMNAELRPGLNALVGGHAASSTFPSDAMDAAAVGAWLAKGRALQTMLKLRPESDSREWEKAFEKYIQDRLDSDVVETVKVAGAFHESLGAESANMCTGLLIVLSFTFLLMSLYAIGFAASQTRARGNTQILLIAASVVIPICSCFAALGVAGVFGMRITALCLLTPLHTLASGVDALFAMIMEVREADEAETDIPRIVGRVMARSGPELAASWLTSVAAFTVAAVVGSGIPSFVSFNVLLILGATLNLIGMSTVFPAFLAMSERRIAGGYSDLKPWAPHRSALPEGSPTGGQLSRLQDRLEHSFLHGIVSSVKETRLGSRLRTFVQEKYSPLVEESRTFRATGASAYAGLVILGFALLHGVGRGVADREFVADGSFLGDFFDASVEHFGGTRLEEASLLFEAPRFHDAAQRARLEELTATLGARNDVAGVSCWPAELPSDSPIIASSSSLATWLRGPDGSAALRDVTFVGGGDALAAARCGVLHWQPLDPALRATQAKEFVDLAKSVSAIAYHMTWAHHVSRQEVISDITIHTMAFSGIAIFLALLLFLPMRLAIMATLNILFSTLTVFAIMNALGWTANAVSYTALVSALGFCADYTAVICFNAQFDLPRSLKWGARMRKSLYTCGTEVFHGCATAILGVFLLVFSGSVAFREWCALVVLISLCGGFFSLVGLPAVVSFLEEEGVLVDNPQEMQEVHCDEEEGGEMKTTKITFKDALQESVIRAGWKVLLKDETMARAAFDGSGFSWDPKRPDFTGRIVTIQDVGCYAGKGFKVPGCPFGWPVEAIEAVLDRDSKAVVSVSVQAACAGLKAKKSDPFVVCRIAGKQASEFHVHPDKSGETPVWTHSTKVGGFVNGDVLEFELRDHAKDMKGKTGHVLGRGTLECKKFYPSGFEGDIELKLPDKKSLDATLTVKVSVVEAETWSVPPDKVAILHHFEQALALKERAANGIEDNVAIADAQNPDDAIIAGVGPNLPSISPPPPPAFAAAVVAQEPLHDSAQLRSAAQADDGEVAVPPWLETQNMEIRGASDTQVTFGFRPETGGSADTMALRRTSARSSPSGAPGGPPEIMRLEEGAECCDTDTADALAQKQTSASGERGTTFVRSKSTVLVHEQLEHARREHEELQAQIEAQRQRLERRRARRISTDACASESSLSPSPAGAKDEGKGSPSSADEGSLKDTLREKRLHVQEEALTQLSERQQLLKQIEEQKERLSRKRSQKAARRAAEGAASSSSDPAAAFARPAAASPGEGATSDKISSAAPAPAPMPPQEEPVPTSIQQRQQALRAQVEAQRGRIDERSRSRQRSEGDGYWMGHVGPASPSRQDQDAPSASSTGSPRPQKPSRTSSPAGVASTSAREFIKNSRANSPAAITSLSARSGSTTDRRSVKGELRSQRKEGHQLHSESEVLQAQIAQQRARLSRKNTHSLSRSGTARGDAETGNFSDRGLSEDPPPPDTAAASASYSKPVPPLLQAPPKTPDQPPRVSTAGSMGVGSTTTRSSHVEEGWEKATDPVTGDNYYYNVEKNLTTWDKPTAGSNPEVFVPAYDDYSTNKADDAGEAPAAQAAPAPPTADESAEPPAEAAPAPAPPTEEANSAEPAAEEDEKAEPPSEAAPAHPAEEATSMEPPTEEDRTAESPAEAAPAPPAEESKSAGPLGAAIDERDPALAAPAPEPPAEHESSTAPAAAPALPAMDEAPLGFATEEEEKEDDEQRREKLESSFKALAALEEDGANPMEVPADEAAAFAAKEQEEQAEAQRKLREEQEELLAQMQAERKAEETSRAKEEAKREEDVAARQAEAARRAVEEKEARARAEKEEEERILAEAAEAERHADVEGGAMRDTMSMTAATRMEEEAEARRVEEARQAEEEREAKEAEEAKEVKARAEKEEEERILSEAEREGSEQPEVLQQTLSASDAHRIEVLQNSASPAGEHPAAAEDDEAARRAAEEDTGRRAAKEEAKRREEEAKAKADKEEEERILAEAEEAARQATRAADASAKEAAEREAKKKADAEAEEERILREAEERAAAETDPDRLIQEAEEATTPLASGWSKAIDPESGDPYYFNTDNGTVSWDRPRQDGTLPTPRSERTEALTERSSLPDQWEKAIDPATGDAYYYSHTHGTSTWDKPGRLQEPPVPAPFSPAASSILPEGWDRALDPETGDKYYYNHEEGVSSWDRPRTGAQEAASAPLSPASTSKLADGGEMAPDAPAPPQEAMASSASAASPAPSSKPRPTRTEAEAQLAQAQGSTPMSSRKPTPRKAGTPVKAGTPRTDGAPRSEKSPRFLEEQQEAMEQQQSEQSAIMAQIEAQKARLARKSKSPRKPSAAAEDAVAPTGSASSAAAASGGGREAPDAPAPPQEAMASSSSAVSPAPSSKPRPKRTEAEAQLAQAQGSTPMSSRKPTPRKEGTPVKAGTPRKDGTPRSEKSPRFLEEQQEAVEQQQSEQSAIMAQIEAQKARLARKSKSPRKPSAAAEDAVAPTGSASSSAAAASGGGREATGEAPAEPGAAPAATSSSSDSGGTTQAPSGSGGKAAA